MRTITCTDWRGEDIQKTRAEFQMVWEDELQELYKLSMDKEWQDKVTAMQTEAHEQAGKEFDRLLAEQS